MKEISYGKNSWSIAFMKKLQWWYWSSLFGRAYKKAYSSIDKRIISDIPQLFAYLSKPKTKWNEISDLRDGVRKTI